MKHRSTAVRQFCKSATWMCTAVLCMGVVGSALAAPEPGTKIFFAIHSSPSNVFWQAVKKGFDDACTITKSECQMVFTQTEGSVQQQLANIEAGLVRKPDALLLSIVDPKVFASVIERARSSGIIVEAVNVDAEGGAKATKRQAYVGQGFVPAGYSLGKAMEKYFPASGPLKILVGVSAPGQAWSEQRASGVIKFLEEYKKQNQNREISWERIDSSTDLGVAAQRVGAKLNADKNINVYFDTGFWDAGVAKALKDRNVPPGKVLLGGFDMVPEALQEIKSGYIQVHVDQQPYMQGFMGVMNAYLAKTVHLNMADIDTGQGVVEKKDVDQVLTLSKQGLR